MKFGRAVVVVGGEIVGDGGAGGEPRGDDDEGRRCNFSGVHMNMSSRNRCLPRKRSADG